MDFNDYSDSYTDESEEEAHCDDSELFAEEFLERKKQAYEELIKALSLPYLYLTGLPEFNISMCDNKELLVEEHEYPIFSAAIHVMAELISNLDTECQWADHEITALEELKAALPGLLEDAESFKDLHEVWDTDWDDLLEGADDSD